MPPPRRTLRLSVQCGEVALCRGARRGVWYLSTYSFTYFSLTYLLTYSLKVAALNLGVLEQLRTLELSSTGEVQAASHKAINVLGEVLTPQSRRAVQSAWPARLSRRLKDGARPARRRNSPLSRVVASGCQNCGRGGGCVCCGATTSVAHQVGPSSASVLSGSGGPADASVSGSAGSSAGSSTGSAGSTPK